MRGRELKFFRLEEHALYLTFALMRGRELKFGGGFTHARALEFALMRGRELKCGRGLQLRGVLARSPSCEGGS